jgi:hypothetical protein
MRNRILTVFAAALFVTSVAQAQGPTEPGPEHERLKKLEGTWDAVVDSGGEQSKGTMTYKMELGGLWLIGHYKGQFGDLAFEGRGADGYDTQKGKYVATWIDSMSTTPMISEGTYDESEKTLTMIGEGAGPTGNNTKYKSVTKMIDENKMKFTMSMQGADGEYSEIMTIDYTRRK